ncbi:MULTISPECIES: phytanoyl-CoA dioxygenase family protein [unclassified Streptomyces]|uniref:phytanoyl-CoA dioxygenase family protein n=1 Tax=unclassified Streptomyces TaxID=2593676 RepID=UPI00379E516F
MPGRYHFSGEVTAKEKAFYEENGFVVYEGFLSPDEVARITAEADAYQEMIRDGKIPAERIDKAIPVARDESGRIAYYHRLNYFTEQSATAAGLAGSSAMDAVRTGLGSDRHQLLENSLNGVVWQLKTGESRSGYSRIRWHGDFPPGHELSPAFTAGVYLNDSNRFNGCLAVIPGSHRNPVGPVAPEPFYIEVGAGDLVCHHEWIYHGSEAMPRRDDRRATLYFYYCAGRGAVADNAGSSRYEHISAADSLFVSAASEETS